MELWGECRERSRRHGGGHRKVVYMTCEQRLQSRRKLAPAAGDKQRTDWQERK